MHVTVEVPINEKWLQYKVCYNMKYAIMNFMKFSFLYNLLNYFHLKFRIQDGLQLFVHGLITINIKCCS